MELFLEATIDSLKNTVVSGLTQYNLDIRYQNDFYIDLGEATYNSKENYLELIFFANSTFGDTSFIAATNLPQGKNGQYTLCLRFYDVNSFLKNEKNMGYSELEKALYSVIHSCDVKFYSDDPSWYFQGGWEACDKENLSIYKFPGPPGKNIWTNRHKSSGGLSGDAHLSKHLVQVVYEIDNFIKKIAQNLYII